MSPVSIPFFLSALRKASAGMRPPVAVALGAEGIAVGAAGSAPMQLAAVVLAPGTIRPGIVESNIAQATEIAATLRNLLGQVETRGRAATLIVPDASVRVFLLDFDTFPAKREEAIPILRFRLRKSVAFDVEHAAVSYQVLVEGSARAETQWKVLAVLMPGTVREEYEGVMRAAGLEPGVVLPASLASLCPLESQQAELLVCHSSASLTITLVSGADVLLFRTNDLPDEDAAQRLEIQRTVAVVCAFYEDTLRAAPGRILYAGAVPEAEFSAMLEDTAVPVQSMTEFAAIPSAAGIPSSLLGLASAAAGALTGAG